MRHNTRCRICGSGELTKFLDLGNQPLANSFLKTVEEFETEELYPLHKYAFAKNVTWFNFQK